MAVTNRHTHWIREIEELLNTIPNLNILTIFNPSKWTNYQFPYAYVALAPETIDSGYENAFNVSGIIEFMIGVGIEVNTNEDIRENAADLTQLIELKFKGWNIDPLSTDNFDLWNNYVRLTSINPIPSDETTKQFFMISGEIGYNQEWKLTTY